MIELKWWRESLYVCRRELQTAGDMIRADSAPTNCIRDAPAAASKFMCRHREQIYPFFCNSCWIFIFSSKKMTIIKHVALRSSTTPTEYKMTYEHIHTYTHTYTCVVIILLYARRPVDAHICAFSQSNRPHLSIIYTCCSIIIYLCVYVCMYEYVGFHKRIYTAPYILLNYFINIFFTNAVRTTAKCTQSR